VEVRYTALVNLKIGCPGQTPSTLRLTPGDIFSLDGTEGIHVGQLLRSRAIRLYVEKKEAKRGRNNSDTR